jgi:ribA/ribD-fused uncharacterized protein
MIRNGEIFFYLKDNEHGWLSNFYPSRFVCDGKEYFTVEHYYQACKATSRDFHNWIADAPNPYHAMRAGRALRIDKGELHSEWESVKDDVMLAALLMKFRQDDGLKKLLLDTDDLLLHEDSPTDEYWGVLGLDKLGGLLMQTREIIKNEELLPTENKIYQWDCITMHQECFSCEYHHVLTTGPKAHKCPFGLKQRLRRIG